MPHVFFSAEMVKIIAILMNSNTFSLKLTPDVFTPSRIWQNSNQQCARTKCCSALAVPQRHWSKASSDTTPPAPLPRAEHERCQPVQSLLLFPCCRSTFPITDSSIISTDLTHQEPTMRALLYHQVGLLEPRGSPCRATHHRCTLGRSQEPWEEPNSLAISNS